MSNRIRDIRKAKGLTLADVAAACTPPTTAQTIGRLETGTRTLSLVWLNRIADALGVTIAFFFEGLAEGDVPKAPGADLMADKEALELVRSYYAIPEAQRRRLFDLARVLSDAA